MSDEQVATDRWENEGGHTRSAREEEMIERSARYHRNSASRVILETFLNAEFFSSTTQRSGAGES